jgi:hypothetical protein
MELNADYILSDRRNRHSFRQLIGEHAIHMCELQKANCKESKKGLMKTWADIVQLNEEWIRLLTLNEHQPTDFGKLVRELVETFSDVMSDAILDKNVDKARIKRLVDMEWKFYDAVSSNLADSRATQHHWERYVYSILDLPRYPENCVRQGILLGIYLDSMIC